MPQFTSFGTDVGQVDDVTADLIISQLLLLDAEDPKKDIKLFINSPGGSVTAGMFNNAINMLGSDYSPGVPLIFVFPLTICTLHK